MMHAQRQLYVSPLLMICCNTHTSMPSLPAFRQLRCEMESMVKVST